MSHLRIQSPGSKPNSYEYVCPPGGKMEKSPSTVKYKDSHGSVYYWNPGLKPPSAYFIDTDLVHTNSILMIRKRERRTAYKEDDEEEDDEPEVGSLIKLYKCEQVKKFSSYEKKNNKEIEYKYQNIAPGTLDVTLEEVLQSGIRIKKTVAVIVQLFNKTSLDKWDKFLSEAGVDKA